MNYIDLNELNTYNVELDESGGDFIHCRRQYSQTGAFSCSGGEMICSSSDVAYLMRSLQEYGVEHTFACFVRKDESPVILHMGMGSFDACIINVDVIRYTADRLDAVQVYMVHNHPSGTLVFSGGDRSVHMDLERVLGERMKGSIVINTTSGKYLFAEGSQAAEVVNKIPVSVNGDEQVAVLEFDRQVFSKDWSYDRSFCIRDSDGVAAFLSSQRFGERDKSGMLILNKAMRVMANLQLPYSSLTRSRVVNLVSYMQNCTCAFGGTAVLPYFTGNISPMMLRLLNAEFRKNSSFDMVDVCFNVNARLKSALDEGLMDSISHKPKLFL